MFHLWRELAKDHAGATMVTYSLIIALVGLAVGVGAAATGTSLEGLFYFVANTITVAVGLGGGST